MNVLHGKPFECLLVLGVDAGGLDEPGLPSRDALGLVPYIEVHGGDCVDHFGEEVMELREEYSEDCRLYIVSRRRL